jgi:hypothetical protein
VELDDKLRRRAIARMRDDTLAHLVQNRTREWTWTWDFPQLGRMRWTAGHLRRHVEPNLELRATCRWMPGWTTMERPVYLGMPLTDIEFELYREDRRKPLSTLQCVARPTAHATLVGLAPWYRNALRDARPRNRTKRKTA